MFGLTIGGSFLLVSGPFTAAGCCILGAIGTYVIERYYS
jgi:hypothetical protein